MTVPATEGQPTEGQGAQGGNPNWQEFLTAVPQEYHEKVTPVLQKWDSGVQQMVQKVHQGYEPWKPIIDSGIEPDVAQYGVNLLNAMEDNPREFARLLMEYYQIDPKDFGNITQGSGNGQSTPGQGQEPEGDALLQAKLAEMEKQQNLVAEYLIAQREKAVEEEQYKQLSAELDAAHKKHATEKGFDFDESFVLARLNAGRSMDDAISDFYTLAEKVVQQRAAPSAPQLLGSGGSSIFGKQKPGEMSDADVRDLTVQFLHKLNQGG